MSEPSTLFETDQDKVARAVHGLMSAAKDVSELSKDQFLQSLVKLEYEDIEITHIHIGRVLEHLRERRST